MKRFWAALLFALAVMAAAVGQGEGQKVLVAYFSRAREIMQTDLDGYTTATPRANNTEQIARKIAELTGGELFEIQTEQVYPLLHSENSEIAGREKEADARPMLTSRVADMAQFDTVILGYPLWWYTAPMAVRTFLEAYDFSGKTILPFATSLGAGMEESLSDIQRLCPDAQIGEGLLLTNGQEDRSGEIETWLERQNLIAEEKKITLTIGDVVLDAYLNDTTSASELFQRLPLTVWLYNSGHDYCGSIDPALPYDEGDVQYGWKDGDLAFWTAGDDFVIFHDDEETSAQTGNLIILGHVTSDIEKIRALPDQIAVTIDKAEPVEESRMLKMKITVGGKKLTATLEDNATTRALMEKMPMTLPMMDLYGREMCYRFEEELPAEQAEYGSFDVGDISYWTPWHSFVIVYAESGESIDHLQPVGTVDEGVEWFAHTGDAEVTFEMMNE